MEKKETEALTEGALCGEFYVGEGKKVRFSKGNLQFNAVQGTHKTSDGEELPGTWRFAEHQWDTIGEDNENINEKYDGFVDLFGWGTSGWNSGVKCFQPWSISEDDKDYLEGGEDRGLTDLSAKADWGVYNAISNGGNEPNKWRTLTIEELNFLFDNNKWSIGTIDGKMCFLLIPKGVSGLFVIRDPEEFWGDWGWKRDKSNRLTVEQFKKYENQGVVALPCCGIRFGNTVDYYYDPEDEDVPEGYYWASTSAVTDEDTVVMGFSFGHENLCEYNDSYLQGKGRSVRLVQDI